MCVTSRSLPLDIPQHMWLGGSQSCFHGFLAFEELAIGRVISCFQIRKQVTAVAIQCMKGHPLGVPRLACCVLATRLELDALLCQDPPGDKGGVPRITGTLL